MHQFLHFVPFLTSFRPPGSPPQSCLSFKVPAQITPSPRSFPDDSSKNYSPSYVFPRGKEEKDKQVFIKQLIYFRYFAYVT